MDEPATNLAGDVKKLQSIVQLVCSDEKTAKQHYVGFKAVLEEYQEQPQLLDAHLEGLCAPLLELLARAADYVHDVERFNAIMQTCRLLQCLVHTCGHKTIARFMPNKPPDLSRAMTILMHLRSIKASSHIDEDAQDGHWQTTCVVLRWLAVLVQIPFDLHSVQLPASMEVQNIHPADKQFVPWLISTVKGNLFLPGPARDMTALLLSKLLTREDMNQSMHDVMQWCWGTLSSKDTSGAIGRTFMVAGILATVSHTLKAGNRKVVIGIVEEAFSNVTALSNTEELSFNSLGRKLALKVQQRCALTLLDPLRMNSIAQQTRHQKRKGVQTHSEEAVEVLALTEMGMGLLPRIIDALLLGLCDIDTIVRWSAAKGLGRIAARLPSSCVEDVNNAILELLNPLQSDCGWQGACLAVAEVARQGLLPVHRLPKVVPLVCQALHFEQRRGAFSVGSHVRDAAAYVCWSFARAYQPAAILESFQVLAPALLCTACCDREVTCRRAAAAAFQESVGRLGAQNFPEGMDIISSADYFSLGSRRQSFLTVAPSIARLPQYHVPVFEHVCTFKVCSWDIQVRELAAECLSALIPLNPDFAAEHVFNVLLPQCNTASSMELQHGSILAVAAMLPILDSSGFVVNEQQRAAVIATAVLVGQGKGPQRIGKNADVIAITICNLIATISSLQYSLDESQHPGIRDAWESMVDAPADWTVKHAQKPHLEERHGLQMHALLAVVNTCVLHMDVAVRAAAGACLHHFLKCYACDELLQLSSTYCNLLEDGITNRRIGGAIALGMLPCTLAAPRMQSIVKKLCSAVHMDTAKERGDVTARVAAIEALVSLLATVYTSGDSEAEISEKDACLVLQPMLLECLQDYTTDKRGDVGSHVREAAMKALVAGIQQIKTHDVFPEGQFSIMVMTCAQKCLKQSVERIARIRETATSCTLQMLACQGTAQNVQHQKVSDQVTQVLQTIVDKGVTGRVQSLPHIIGLMTVRDLRQSILEGVIASIGGVDQTLSQAAANALVALVLAPDNSGSTSDSAPSNVGLPVRLDGRVICHDLLALWKQHERSPRMATPILKTLNVLLTRGVIDRMCLSAADADQIVELIRREGRKCSDAPKLVCIADALCQLAVLVQAEAALQALMVLLTSKLPTVRKAAAEHLYISTVRIEARNDKESILWTQGCLHVLQDILCSTSWEGADMDSLRSSRSQIIDLLNLKTPQQQTKMGSNRTVSAAASSSSYQSLVNDFARGI